MVRRAGRLLGRDRFSLREERHQLPPRQLVARPQGTVRGERSCVSLHAEAWRHGLGQLR